jgi:glutamate synthase (NADPH/NADH) small chain
VIVTNVSAERPFNRDELDVDRKRKAHIPVQPVPKQASEARVYNFNETYLEYPEETARVEAARCIQCPDPAPCIVACPVHNDIPGALLQAEQGNFIAAASIFRRTSSLPEVCGRVCPQEILCEGSCTVGRAGFKPVTIGRLEAFVTDYQRKHGVPTPEIQPTGARVAIVGSGPAGIGCAEELAKHGHEVTVYEYWPEPGGILLYGIPNFKLDKTIVEWKIRWLESLGVKFVTNTKVGSDILLNDLLEEYHAVFLGIGAGVGAPLKAEGEELEGVFQATDFLVRYNLPDEMLPPRQQERPPVGPRIVILGAGDTAMDCTRTSLRLIQQHYHGNGTVTVVYRRTETEMAGRYEERKHAKEEGAHWEFLTQPVKFLGDEKGHVRGVECVRMRLGEPDASGRRRPIKIDNSNFVIECDTVALALGYWPDPELGQQNPALETHDWGLFTVNDEFATSKPRVWAGGDDVNGADLVVTALADGRRAAASINRYLEREVLSGELISRLVEEPA